MISVSGNIVGVASSSASYPVAASEDEEDAAAHDVRRASAFGRDGSNTSTIASGPRDGIRGDGTASSMTTPGSESRLAEEDDDDADSITQTHGAMSAT